MSRVIAVYLMLWVLPTMADVGPLKQGWHWGFEKKEQLKKLQDKPVQDKEQPQVPLEPELNAVEQLKLIQKELELRKAKAVLNPTQENIVSYLSYQKEMVLDKAGDFTKGFMKALWLNPELDYSNQTPTGTLAKRVWMQEEDKKKTKFLSALRNEIGFFFFFRSDCPYCHKFAPILKSLTNKFGFKVVAISLDGGTLPQFPDARLDNGQFEKLANNQKVVPAVFAVFPKTNQVTPISFGLVSEDEIVKRLLILTKQGSVQ